MKIVLNGEAHEMPPASTLARALDQLGFGAAVVATALNGEFVASAARRETQLSEGDRIEVLAPMQGG
jgi:sulfur carrier protein